MIMQKEKIIYFKILNLILSRFPLYYKIKKRFPNYHSKSENSTSNI